LPLYKTGRKEYDEVIEVINEKKQMDEVAENPEKMTNFLFKKSQKFDEVVLAEFRREMYNERYLKVRFGLYQREAEIKYMKALYDEKGKLKKDIAKSVFEEGLKVAERKMDEETDEGDKNDIWENDIRPHYLTLDSIKYSIEKKALEKDNEEKKGDLSKQRAKERQEIGMSI